jgi:hypothetical protein
LEALIRIGAYPEKVITKSVFYFFPYFIVLGTLIEARQDFQGLRGNIGAFIVLTGELLDGFPGVKFHHRNKLYLLYFETTST